MAGCFLGKSAPKRARAPKIRSSLSPPWRNPGLLAIPMPKPKAGQAAADVPPSYEAAAQELDALLARLDGGQLPLDELLTQHQRGNELLAYCRARLEALEQQLTVLENGAERPWTPQP